MRLLFLVNDVGEMVARQTTTLLIMAAAGRHETWVCGVSDLTWCSGAGLRAQARKIGKIDRGSARLVAGLRQQAAKELEVGTCDAVMIRTNPGRDGQRLGSHDVALHLLTGAAQQGLLVVNDPATLRKAWSKVYLTQLPAHVVPPLIVSREAAEVKAWIERLDGAAVVKPVRGTRGQDVFLVEKDRSNLAQMIEVIQRDGYVMAQAFVPGGHSGDVRVLVLEGEVLEVDGRAAAVARVPGSRDFRSNIAAGGEARPAGLDGPKRAAVAAIAETIRRDGLFFVGVDFIGDKIIELNVFSPGGLGNAADHQERDFSLAVIEALERRVRAGS